MRNKNFKNIGKVFVTAMMVMSLGLAPVVTPAQTASAAVASDYVSQFRSDASSAADALKRANDLNQKIAEEGIVLMKNQNNVLPLSSGLKISVFGKNSVNPFYGGGGSASGADGSGLGGVKYYNLFDSLENAGFVVNPTLKAFYENNSLSGNGRDGGSGTGQVPKKTGETPVSKYRNQEKESFALYNDAALIFIARGGGEGGDLATSYGSNVEGRSNYSKDGKATSGDHYLELDDNEKDLIAMAKENFDKVIVAINIGTSFEMESLENDTGVDSVLWMGMPGGSGINALGKVLNGEVNPSGRTVDIYARDFKKDPTFANFATNSISTYKTSAGSSSGVTFVEYDEGIYVGYRYYETRGFVEGGDWYDKNVVYPFGYGLSYTSFEWDVDFVTEKISADGKIEVDVTVTNTGNVAGKDVVELYYNPPYIEGEIEKSHVALGAYEKTNLLQPGMSQTLRVSMPVRTMASYDFNDANANGIQGYELDKGDYTIYVGKNSHVWADGNAASKVYNLSKEVYYETDEVTGTKVENQFDYVSVYFDENSTEVFGGHSKVMSRTDFEGTFPVAPTTEEATLTTAEIDKTKYTSADEAYDADQPWYSSTRPKQATTTETKISATRMVGVPYNDKRWDTFMNQLTLEDLRDIVVSGYFITKQIDAVDLPLSITPDGPTGFVQGSGSNWVGETCFYCSPILVASTWNKDLARAMGEAVGDEGIWGGEKGVQGGYNGWYAPGNNIHRSPFSGRNFEYYSEDPVLAGTICAEVVAGAQSKGVFVMMKHFALNDQETYRGNIATWANEQTMREIYLKSFEYAVKAGATGMMSAFNRIGYAWCGMTYPLLTEVLRNEWGFNGLVITDWVNSFMQADLMIRAGNDLWLARGNANTLSATGSATHVTNLRKAAKNVIYAVVNSNAMNRLGSRYSEEFYKAAQKQYSKNLGSFDKGAQVNFNAKSAIYSGYEYVLNGAPEGITINSATGEISGTISSNAIAGTYDMTVSLKDEGGFIGQSVKLSLTVNGGLSYIGTEQANVVKDKFARVDVRSQMGGKDVSYEVEGTLPTGMTLTADGYIVGKPLATGSSTVTVKASAEDVETVAKQVVINVKEAEEIAFSGSISEITLNEEFTFTFTSDKAGAVFSAKGLPKGVALSENGVLSGTPEKEGEYNVTISVYADGCKTATQQIKITVKKPQDNSSSGGDGNDGSPNNKNGNTGLVVGIVSGSVVLVGAICAAVVIVLKKKKK